MPEGCAQAVSCHYSLKGGSFATLLNYSRHEDTRDLQAPLEQAVLLSSCASAQAQLVLLHPPEHSRQCLPLLYATSAGSVLVG